MQDFRNAHEGMDIVRVTDYQKGVIQEIGDRRPVRALVRWQDGSEQWMHPEQIRPVDVLAAPAPTKLTSWGRTTPEYIKQLRKEIRDQRKGQPMKKKVSLESMADQFLRLGTKGRRKAKRVAYQEAIARDDQRDLRKEKRETREWYLKISGGDKS